MEKMYKNSHRKKKGKEYKNTKERHSPKYQVIYKKDANISQDSDKRGCPRKAR